METLTLESEIVKGWGGRETPEAAGAPAAPSARPGDAGPVVSLPCLFIHNVTKRDEKRALELSEKWAQMGSKSDRQRKLSDKYMLGRDKKAAESLFLNASALLGRGVERCAFVTITTAQNLSYWTPEGWKAARDRFRSWSGHKNGLAYVFGAGRDWCRVIEPQRRGAIHWHILIDCGVDIRAGVDFEAFERRDYRSAGPALRGLWSRMRESAKRYGLGRVEIMPVKSDKWEAAARYVGKYISKGIAREGWERYCDGKVKPDHARRVGFSAGGWRVSNTQFSWLVSGSEWREAVKWFAISNGCEDYGDLRRIFGKRWAWRNRENIMEGFKEFRENPNENTPF